MITVVIIDDQALIRHGFTLILESAADIRVVGTGDGIGAVEMIESTNPDVVLLDLQMPVVDGLSVMRSLRERSNRARIVILTTFDTDEYVGEAMQLGASGYLLKDTDPEGLPQHIRSAAHGGVVLSPVAGQVLVSARRVATADPALVALMSALSPRETTVLGLLSQGLTNTEIASALHLAPSTVKDHVSIILGKLGVTTRVQAALIAERSGSLTPGGPGR